MNTEFYPDDFYEKLKNKYSNKFEYYFTLISLINWEAIPLRNKALGRKGYSPRSMAILAFIFIVEKFKYQTQLLDFLKENPKIAHISGIDVKKGYPSMSSFSRHFHSFKNYNLTQLLTDNVKKLLQSGKISLNELYSDSHPILANTSLNNPKKFNNKPDCPIRDKQADYGVKGKSNTDSSKLLYYYGFKKFSIIANGAIPLFSFIAPASFSDKNHLIPQLRFIMDNYDISGSDIVADKGADANYNYDFIHTVFKGRAFIPKVKEAKKPSDISYGRCGSVFQIHSLYFEKKRSRFRVKYRCPLYFMNLECPFKKQLKIPKYGCSSYATLSSGKFRDLFDRHSKTFKSVYSKRLRVENFFSIVETHRLDRIYSYGISFVQLLSAMSDLFLVASALLALKLNKPHLIGSPVKTMRAV